MTRITKLGAAAIIALGLSACGSTTEERVATGALGGAAAGTVAGGGLTGTVLGGAAGAGAGYAYDKYKERNEDKDGD